MKYGFKYNLVDGIISLGRSGSDANPADIICWTDRSVASHCSEWGPTTLRSEAGYPRHKKDNIDALADEHVRSRKNILID
jgi:hypothetical protein